MPTQIKEEWREQMRVVERLYYVLIGAMTISVSSFIIGYKPTPLMAASMLALGLGLMTLVFVGANFRIIHGD